MTAVRIGDRLVGEGQPVMVVGEIGVNHGGSIDLALEMLRLVKASGCDAAKFQIRTPEICVPKDQQTKPRELPDGRIVTYLAYRQMTELGRDGYDRIDAEAKRLGLMWSASAWDVPALKFLLEYDPPFVKIPSACLTDEALVWAAAESGKPIILSTGMSTLEQITTAASFCKKDRLVLMHCTSAYPCKPDELNLAMIPVLAEKYLVPVGFSDHSTGVWAAVCAVVLGASVIEKHFTSDRSLPGSDQSASVEPEGMARICNYVRRWEQARGDGVKVVYDSEKPVMAKLRRFQGGHGDV